MFYSKSITIPPNTPEANAIENRVALSHGIVTKVIFRPRPGHAGLLHCKVFHRRHQIFPSSGDDDLHGDTFPVEWEEWYEIPEKPFYLEIVAWNDDILYPHTFDIAFAELPKWVALPYAIAKGLADVMSVFLPRQIRVRNK